jgi:hypothetical protein
MPTQHTTSTSRTPSSSPARAGRIAKIATVLPLALGLAHQAVSHSTASTSGSQSTEQVQPVPGPGSFTPVCSLPFDGVRNPAIDDHCGIQGGSSNPAKQLESRAKNNFCASGQPLQEVKYEDLLKLQEESAQIPKNIPDRSVLASPGGGKLGEGKYVSYIAFIKEAHYSDVNGGEAVNCNIGGTSTNDIHIVLVQNAADDECKSTTAEMSPHFRPTGWTPDNLNLVHNPVRVQGHMFYDGSHVPCTATSSPNPHRASLWEVHPVYALDVCRLNTVELCRNSTDERDWVPLEQWVKTDQGQ